MVSVENAAEIARKQQEETRAAHLRETNVSAARQRGAQDRLIYAADQLQEIERLYQVANQKGLRNEESRANCSKDTTGPIARVVPPCTTARAAKARNGWTT